MGRSTNGCRGKWPFPGCGLGAVSDSFNHSCPVPSLVGGRYQSDWTAMYRSLPDNRCSDTVSQKWLNKPLFLFRQSVYPQNPLRPLRCCWSLEIKTNQPTNTQPNIPLPSEHILPRTTFRFWTSPTHPELRLYATFSTQPEG